MKYILIILGIFISFFGDILEKESKDDSQKEKTFFKKLTPVGHFLTLIGLFISLFGVFMAYDEEVETKKANKIKNEADSTSLVRKNLSDSTRYSDIIDKLIIANNTTIKQSYENIKTTLIESKKQLNESRNNKFLIPNEFEVDIEIELDLDPSKSKELESYLSKSLGIYMLNGDLSPNFINTEGIGLGYLDKPNVQNELLSSIMNVSNGIIQIFIEFKDDKKQKNLLKIHDTNFTNLTDWKTHKYNRSFTATTRLKNMYSVFYYFKKHKFILFGNSIWLDSDRNSLAPSLNDLLDSNCFIQINIVSFSFKGNIVTTQENLKGIVKNLKLRTKDGLGLGLSHFNKIKDNEFKMKLTKSEKWD